MSGELPVKKKKIYEKLDKQLKEVVLNYEHVTVLNYLKGIACNFSFKKNFYMYILFKN